MKINDIAQAYLNDGLEVDKDYTGYCIDNDTQEIKECFGMISERFGLATLCISFDPKPDEKKDTGIFMRKIHVDVFWTSDLEVIKDRQVKFIAEVKEEIQKEFEDELKRWEAITGKVVKNEKARPGYNRNQAENLHSNIIDLFKDIIIGPNGSTMRTAFEDHQKEETKKQHGG